VLASLALPTADQKPVLRPPVVDLKAIYPLKQVKPPLLDPSKLDLLKHALIKNPEPAKPDQQMMLPSIKKPMVKAKSEGAKKILKVKPKPNKVHVAFLFASPYAYKQAYNKRSIEFV
jgi:hypothetical protein